MWDKSQGVVLMVEETDGRHVAVETAEVITNNSSCTCEELKTPVEHLETDKNKEYL